MSYDLKKLASMCNPDANWVEGKKSISDGVFTWKIKKNNRLVGEVSGYETIFEPIVEEEKCVEFYRRSPKSRLWRSH